jgi:hypothetical protein
MGFESAAPYLRQLIASTLAGNEEDTFIDSNGRLANGCDIDRGGLPYERYTGLDAWEGASLIK